MPVRAFPLSLLAACLPAALLADTTVTGSATYRERIALSGDAMLIVEARGFGNSLLAEVRRPLDGAQVPVDFELTLPDGMSATIRAGIAAGSSIDWASAPISYTAEGSTNDLGEVLLRRHVPMIYTHAYRCGDRLIEISFADEIAVMNTGTDHVRMEAVPVASGIGYEAAEDPGTFFRGKEASAQVGIGGGAPADCHLAPPAEPETWRARGNEPFWALDAAEGRLTLTRPATDPVGGVRSATTLLGNGHFQMAAPEAGLTAILSHTICRDTMSGMIFPQEVIVRLDGEELQGCGGRPEDLLTGHVWRVEGIEGADLAPDAPATMAFEPGGGLSGTSGCNRYTASYTMTGEGLTISPAASTMMACADPVMRQEQAFFNALGRVVRFDVAEETGTLILMDAEGPVMTLAPEVPG